MTKNNPEDLMCMRTVALALIMFIFIVGFMGILLSNTSRYLIISDNVKIVTNRKPVLNINGNYVIFENNISSIRGSDKDIVIRYDERRRDNYFILDSGTHTVYELFFGGETLEHTKGIVKYD